ncbi:hypothetical protein QO209_10880 [Pseudomonas citronellolis]|uniref:hypothetical protein n=1 Tax=Pseudomonas citronellolis TaxID=53408 RepID=UPI00264A2444|nr:hypothetical protein [Pseudomonas citronellolis]MDN6872950.1 hypothetical protein [Pseudomonas citronellolis]
MLIARVQPPRVRFRFRILREGEVTAGQKYLAFYQNLNSQTFISLGFATDDGEYTQWESVRLSALTDQGDWMVIGYDDTAPKKIRAAYLSISADGTYTFNITAGDGGAAGDPAALEARVRVEGSAVSREVLVVERPSSGQWRVAGYGPVSGGDGAIEVRVTDGDCYAIGLDEWGVAFAPSLSVVEGQVIRPTVFLGWLYRITQAGVLPSVEPDWWDESVEGPQLLGTARAVVSRYYRPLAHGPLPVEEV